MSFDQSVQRIGFACKYMHPVRELSAAQIKDIERAYNGTTTTKAFLEKQTPTKARDKLLDVVRTNLQSYRKLVKYVSELEPPLRMLRLSSDVLPFYTEPTWGLFYKDPQVAQMIEKELKSIGDIARENDVRLSMHPGQFTVLASNRFTIVQNSIAEMEYHADVASMMGYGKEWQDFKINVHISGANGPAGIKDILPKLSLRLHMMLTIENEEITWGLGDILELENDVALVLDVHHHWVHSNEYLDVQDDRVQRVIASWKGVRPTMHYSVSKDDVVRSRQTLDVLPDRNVLKAAGAKTRELRAHSDTMWHPLVNQYAKSFWPHFDIMVESKFKNLSARQLWESFK